MATLVLLFSSIAFLQITPSYRARQLNAEGIRLMQMDRAAEAEVSNRENSQKAYHFSNRESPVVHRMLRSTTIWRKPMFVCIAPMMRLR